MRKRVLAASFVVTVTGCGKQQDPDRPPQPRIASVMRSRDPKLGGCQLDVPITCNPTRTCNPPPPIHIDCPTDLREAGDPEAPSRRPKGKEDWVRVRPFIYVGDSECSLTGEYFCAGPGKPHECTAQPPSQTLACTTVIPAGGIPDAGRQYVRRDHARIASFVWKDGVGQCHRIPEIECKGWCHEIPEGESVPCAP